MLKVLLPCPSCLCGFFSLQQGPVLHTVPRSARPCRGWRLKPGDGLVVTGNCPELGSWQADSPLRMTETCTPVWQAEVGCTSSSHRD